MQNARLNMEKAQVQQAKYYEKRHEPSSSSVGDLILLRTHILSDKSKKIIKKFSPRCTGRFKVIATPSPLTCTLVSLETDEAAGTHNVKNLKKYFERASFEDS